MEGTTDALIMDINKTRFNSNRIMQPGGFAEIETYINSLEARIDDTYRR